MPELLETVRLAVRTPLLVTATIGSASVLVVGLTPAPENVQLYPVIPHPTLSLVKLMVLLLAHTLILLPAGSWVKEEVTPPVPGQPLG